MNHLVGGARTSPLFLCLALVTTLPLSFLSIHPSVLSLTPCFLFLPMMLSVLDLDLTTTESQCPACGSRQDVSHLHSVVRQIRLT